MGSKYGKWGNLMVELEKGLGMRWVERSHIVEQNEANDMNRSSHSTVKTNLSPSDFSRVFIRKTNKHGPG